MDPFSLLFFFFYPFQHHFSAWSYNELIYLVPWEIGEPFHRSILSLLHVPCCSLPFLTDVWVSVLHSGWLTLDFVRLNLDAPDSRYLCCEIWVLTRNTEVLPYLFLISARGRESIQALNISKSTYPAEYCRSTPLLKKISCIENVPSVKSR